MSDEFDSNSDSHFSPFWPLVIVLAGLLIWFGFQDYALNSQRVAYSQAIEGAKPKLGEAQAYYERYKKLMGDLVDTAQKDPNAAAIVKEALQAGLLKLQPNATNSTGTPTPPSAPATTSAPAK